MPFQSQIYDPSRLPDSANSFPSCPRALLLHHNPVSAPSYWHICCEETLRCVSKNACSAEHHYQQGAVSLNAYTTSPLIHLTTSPHHYCCQSSGSPDRPRKRHKPTPRSSHLPSLNRKRLKEAVHSPLLANTPLRPATYESLAFQPLVPSLKLFQGLYQVSRINS